MSIANYTIQEWLFNEAHGKFELDLAESGVQFQTLGDLEVHNDWVMDYSQDRGAEDLRSAVKQVYGELSSDQDSLIAHGAQEALYLFYRSTLNAGDHVLTITPGWQQSWEVPNHIGCEVTKVDWAPNQAFNIAGVQAAINENTRLIVLNSPCNPTGMSITENEWNQLIELAKTHDLWLLNDEEYLLDFSQSIVHKYQKSLSVASLSKVYGLPALRVGWAVSTRETIEAMVNYKRYTTVCNSWVLERLALQALQNREHHIARYQAFIDEGLKYLLGFAELAHEYVELVPPQNTPYAWFNLKQELNSECLAKQLLSEHRLLVMPAEVFGASQGIRVTYARSPEILKAGFNKILETLGVVERL